MPIEEGDFVELDYTGRHDEGVFDTTREDVAEEHDLRKQDVSSIIVTVGEGQLVPGLDDALVGKEVGESYTIDVPVEDAFGKKDSDLLSIVPRSEFDDQGIQPFVGLEVTIDNERGTVRSVSGGRVIVDFNHPLAGKDLTYDVEIHRFVDDPEERVEATLQMMGVPYESLSTQDEKVVIELNNDLPENVKEDFKEKIEDTTGHSVRLATPSSEEE